MPPPEPALSPRGTSSGVTNKAHPGRSDRLVRVLGGVDGIPPFSVDEADHFAVPPKLESVVNVNRERVGVRERLVVCVALEFRPVIPHYH